MTGKARQSGKKAPRAKIAPGPVVAAPPERTAKRKKTAQIVSGVAQSVERGGATPLLYAGSIPASVQPAPEEFTELWSPALSESWNKLNEKQQAFLKEWYLNGFHGTHAYQEVYKTTDESIARSNASRLLANDNIYAFRQAIQSTLRPPLERIQEVFIHALEAETPIFSDGAHVMDIEDHGARMAAAAKLLKMHNLEQPTQVNHNHSGAVTHIIDTKNIQSILNGSDKP